MKTRNQEEKNDSYKAQGGAFHACTCISDFQDKEHGKGVRFMNACKDGSLRCTVCSAKFAK